MHLPLVLTGIASLAAASTLTVRSAPDLAEPAPAPTATASEESKWWPASDKAKAFVKDTIVIDFFASPYGVGWNKSEHLHDYIDRAMQTGITGVSATLAASYQTFEGFMAEVRVWRETMLERDDQFIFVNDVSDIRRAHEEGKYAVIWNVQTTSVLNGNVARVSTLRAMGVSSMQLVYNDTYRSGDGVIAYWYGRDRGLTDYGKTIIDEMVRHGIIVDLSHTGLNTCNDVIEYMTEKHPGVPVVYTHSLPAGLYKDAPKATERGCYRNITDEQAVAAAKTGGVVSPTFTEWMMDGVWPDDISPLQCAQILDYYAKLVGVDHVGIATDDMFTLELMMPFIEANAAAYNDEGYMLNAFKNGAAGNAELAKILPAVTDELWKMGYSDVDIAKIYGANMMRVYEQVWR